MPTSKVSPLIEYTMGTVCAMTDDATGEESTLTSTVPPAPNPPS